MEDAIAVIGSVNMDIGGYSHGPLTAGDSNPGRVRLSVGGVGCNIARNLALLGAKVYLELWVKVKENWRDSDIALSNFGYKE